MPAYEFQCQKCNTEFTLYGQFHPADEDAEGYISFDEPQVCPHCKSKRILRVYGVAAVTYHAKGFYCTDH